MSDSVVVSPVHAVPEPLSGTDAVESTANGAPSPRRRVLGVTATLVVVALIGTGTVWVDRYRERSANAVVSLYTEAVGLGPDGELIGIPGGTDTSVVQFYEGTRVLTPGSAAALTGTPATAESAEASAALAEEQREWLASGTNPAAGGPYEEMTQTALLDIGTLLLSNGASLASWSSAWRYVWPRDAAFVAVALAESGHPDDALRVLEFLQRQQPDDGVFEARYQPDESGVPDSRGEQSDGIGWALWATLQLVRSLPEDEAQKALTTLEPMIETSTAAALRLTDSDDALPPASQDYWEVKTSRLTLGTAAPMALALRSAATLMTRLGDDTTARTAQDRAATLEESITTEFGADGYPRELGGDESDAAVAFLLPPFTEDTSSDVLDAWSQAAEDMVRPAGGLAPGAGWRDDGISWTPQTSLFALTAAATGDTTRATTWLDWLDAHRTAFGAIPEKVLSTGAAAGPAPLAWSSALVVMTVARL